MMDSQINTFQELSVFVEALLMEHTKFIKDNTITSNPKILHKAFYRLKRKYPNYFKRLFFDTNGHYPFSEDLDSILFYLHMSKIINKLNPDFKTITINGTSVDLSEKLKEEIPHISKRRIKQIARDLTKHM